MDYHLRLPLVIGEGPGLGGMTALAAEFAGLWAARQGHRIPLLRCDARLVAVAQAHAAYLDSRVGEALQVNMHIGAGGSTANQRVRAGGYALLDWHKDGNTCESCGRMYADDKHPELYAAQELAGLLASPEHHDHLMGVGFWEPSVIYGIGQVGGDWVVIICPPE